MVRTFCVFATLIVASGSAYCQRGYPPEMPGADVEVYHTSDGVDLNIYIYKPDDFSSDKKYPAIVFFFGGGWRGGSPSQFLEHCKYLASRGMVAMAADYRVFNRHGTRVIDCVRDAKAAVRWIRVNAERLGVDPDRVVASGGSAGGHLAASTGTVPDLEHSDQDLEVSSVPNALVLFNPATVLAPYGDIEMTQQRIKGLQERIGAEIESVSPIHHITKDTPPTIIFHGTADTTVPIESVIAFTGAMKDAGNACTLKEYEGAGHGFFNYGKGDGSAYIDTVRAMDKFLKKCGYLKGKPTVR